MPLPVTAVFAAINVGLLIWLTLRVAGYRHHHRISAGDADNKGFGRRIQAHSNAAEQIPITLILLALAEGLGAPVWLTVLAGLMLTVGRLVHAWHFSLPKVPLIYRSAGMILTLASQALLAFSLILLVYLHV